MTSTALYDTRVTTVLPKLGPGVPARVARYLYGLAAWQTADGVATVSRRQLAAELGVNERTVSKWHAEAERLGLVARIDGGFRGRVQTVRLLLVAPFDRTARKAFAAYAAARRRRQLANRKARERGLFRSPRKGAPTGTPHTSKSEAALNTAPRYARDEAAEVYKGYPTGLDHVDKAPDSAARAALRAYASSRGRIRPETNL